jgi:hypothetical protein
VANIITIFEQAKQLEIMKNIKGINIHNLEVVIKGEYYQRNDVDLGALTLSVDGREFILDVVQTYSDEIEEDGTLRISCELEVDEEVFDECSYDITKDDLLDAEHNDLVRTLYIGGEVEFEVVSITLHFDDCNNQDYQLLVDEE